MEHTYSITVDYSKTLAEMIRSGNYRWRDHAINNKHFQNKLSLNVKLIHYDKIMKLDAVIRNLKIRGLRPATLPELLAFGVKYPEKQRRFRIVALGSTWKDSNGWRLVPSLDSDDFGRGLSLGFWSDLWGRGCYFLVVKK